MKTVFALVLSLMITSNCVAQKLTEQKFKNLMDNPKVPYFDDTRKKYFGCGWELDCVSMKMIFKDIVFRKKNKTLKISGYVNPMTDNNDTTLTTFFRIFVGRVNNDKMEVVKTLLEIGADTIVSKEANTEVRLKEAFFSVEFLFTKDDHFFIESDDPLYRLMDYNIGSLLK